MATPTRANIGSAHVTMSQGELLAAKYAAELALGRDNVSKFDDHPEMRPALIRALAKIKAALETGIVMPGGPRLR